LLNRTVPLDTAAFSASVPVAEQTKLISGSPPVGTSKQINSSLYGIPLTALVSSAI
jgi:hypothetical protein